jgi:simple sugar transport system permease protein
MSELMFSVLRLACPLIFAALGGLLSERSGVINLALEGFMLLGAYTGAVATYSFGSPWLGLCACLGVAALAGLFYSYLVIDQKINQVVAGIGFNLLILGILPFINKAAFLSTGSTPSIPVEQRFEYFPLIAMFVVTLLMAYIMRRTKLGILIRFAGEHPDAVESSGHSVNRIRRMCLVASAALAATGGMALSVCLASSYSPQMSGGRGFIALAALILGKWNVGATLLACLFFGFMDAVQMRLQGVPIFGYVVPVQFIQISPYVLTVLALLNVLGISRPPKKLGIPF